VQSAVALLSAGSPFEVVVPLGSAARGWAVATRVDAASSWWRLLVHEGRSACTARRSAMDYRMTFAIRASSIPMSIAPMALGRADVLAQSWCAVWHGCR